MINVLLRNAIYYAEAFRRRPYWTIVPALAVLVVSVIAIFSLPRSYDAEAFLMIEAPQTSSSLVPATVAGEQLQFVEQRVMAREKLLDVAARFDLFPGLRKTMSDTMLAQLVRQHITIHTVAGDPTDRYAGTSAMRVGFRYESAEQAAAVTAELVRLIIAETRGLRIQRASEMAQFLEREARNLAERLQAREREWQAFVEMNSEARPERIQGLDGELQQKERELATQVQAISTLEQEMRLLEAELRLGQQRPAAATRNQERLTELEAEFAAKSVTYSSEHPEVRALTQRMASLKTQIAQDREKAASLTRSELSPELALVAERVTIGRQRLEELIARREETAARISVLRKTIAEAPGIQSRLEAIQRDRESMQRTVDDMNGRLATARTSERLERDEATAHVQVIEQPETPRYPTSPSRTRLLLFALAASFAGGLGGLYLSDAMQKTIRGTFDLENALAGTTLVVIPRWAADGERRSRWDMVLDRIAGAAPQDRLAPT